MDAPLPLARAGPTLPAGPDRGRTPAGLDRIPSRGIAIVRPPGPADTLSHVASPSQPNEDYADRRCSVCLGWQPSATFDKSSEIRADPPRRKNSCRWDMSTSIL